MGEKKGKIPTGRIARAAVTGLAATRIGAKQLAHMGKRKLKGKSFREEDQSLHEEELGRMLFKTLGMLRGTALKVSQALSQEEDLLPESLRKELAKACHKVIPLNRALVRKVFVREWGVGPDKMFDSFHPEAFAAASLGQVHEASNGNGTRLAVKVQYPGIAATIASDIKLMRTMFSNIAGRVGLLPRRDMLNDAIDEIEERLLEEVDYRQEAESLSWFKKNVGVEGIRIPSVVEGKSGDRVLATERFEGLHIDEWIKTNPSQERRNLVGQRLFDFFITCFFDLKRIHADPHPGNFLVMENEEIGVLDFGCVKRFEDSFPPTLSRIMRAIVENKDGEKAEEVLEAYKQIDLFDKSYTIDEYMNEVDALMKPLQDWLASPYLEETFHFGDMPKMPMAKMHDGFSVAKKMYRVNKDYIFFDRAYKGLTNLLRALKAEINTSAMLAERVVV